MAYKKSNIWPFESLAWSTKPFRLIPTHIFSLLSSTWPLPPATQSGICSSVLRTAPWCRDWLHSSAYYSQKLLWTLKAHPQYVFPAPRLQLLNHPKQCHQMELPGDMFTQPPQWLLWHGCFITEPANTNFAKWMSAEGMGTEHRRTLECELSNVSI